MKQLIILRHAKSNWDYTELSDFERPLGERGRNDIQKTGAFAAEKNLRPDLIVASPATRTSMTARLIAPYVQVDARDIHYISALYEAEEKDWVQLARSLDDNKSCVMMVGHNEGLTDFVNRMTGYLSENIPTSGMVIIDFAIDHWSELKTGCCIDYFFPRRGRG